MTIKKADFILCNLEELAQIYDYDIDNDENYKAACELVTLADWNDENINGLNLEEFNELTDAVRTAIIMED